MGLSESGLGLCLNIFTIFLFRVRGCVQQALGRTLKRTPVSKTTGQMLRAIIVSGIKSIHESSLSYLPILQSSKRYHADE